jgi:hypothetical protein
MTFTKDINKLTKKLEIKKIREPIETTYKKYPLSTPTIQEVSKMLKRRDQFLNNHLELQEYQIK